ncbi:hypothetical protein ACFTAO_19375 [Paenibacillus rhizoplanae]
MFTTLAEGENYYEGFRIAIQKKTGVLLLVLLLATLGTVGGGRESHTAAAAASAKPYVYYVSNDVLYRVTTDGSETQKIAENFDGNGLDSTGKYLYFFIMMTVWEFSGCL